MGVEREGGVLREAFRRGRPEVQSLVPRRVREEVERYLRCGQVRYGFVEVRCEACREPRLVALRCRGRGWCPSCTTRRALETGLQLEAEFPRVAHRQWTLSLPMTARFLVVKQPALLKRLEVRLVQAVWRLHRATARRLGARGRLHGGGVCFWQYFGVDGRGRGGDAAAAGRRRGEGRAGARTASGQARLGGRRRRVGRGRVRGTPGRGAPAAAGALAAGCSSQAPEAGGAGGLLPARRHGRPLPSLLLPQPTAPPQLTLMRGDNTNSHAGPAPAQVCPPSALEAALPRSLRARLGARCLSNVAWADRSREEAEHRNEATQ